MGSELYLFTYIFMFWVHEKNGAIYFLLASHCQHHFACIVLPRANNYSCVLAENVIFHLAPHNKVKYRKS
jgi:hypothetical protein